MNKKQQKSKTLYFTRIFIYRRILLLYTQTKIIDIKISIQINIHKKKHDDNYFIIFQEEEDEGSIFTGVDSLTFFFFFLLSTSLNAASKSSTLNGFPT